MLKEVQIQEIQSEGAGLLASPLHTICKKEVLESKA